MKIGISTGNSRKDKHWNYGEMDISEFKNRISNTIRTSETVEQYRKSGKAHQDEIKDVGGFVLGKLKGGRRKKDCVEYRTALTLDMDYAIADIVDQIEMFFDFGCYIYSTHKHALEKPRLRVIILLTRNVSADEYTAVARKIAHNIGMELFDDTTYEASRLMYWPSTSADGDFFFREIEGEPINPDEVLATYKNWRDTSEWPVSNRQQTIVKRDLKKQTDPLEKEGVVGGFCKAYTITDAIEKYLPEVYQLSALPERFDYIPADSTAGVVIYEEKFAYSHHATDPACGKLLNAFDIVRIHKFGHLDAKVGEDTGPSKLPSFKAMTEFALQDEEIKLQLAKERMKEVSSAFGDLDDSIEWQTELELNKDGTVKDTANNIATILRKDTNFTAIVYNEFKSTIDVIGELPWKQVKPGWGDSDLALAKLYFEKVYKIWSPTKFKDMLLAVATERLYHPIKEYFAKLVWDGTERIETLLVDYLGAEDNSYTRAVTRKTLCAAVARVFEPGIKFDCLLVLNGKQGIGKSTLFARLGRKWYSDSLSIADMKDKTASEKLCGYLILELSELSGIKKVETEVVKSFLSRVDDKYRQAYGVNVESHPRSSIIVGSTNSEGGFLRDISGNRRFWPVHVIGSSKYLPWDMDDETVDQVWAEAIAKYLLGEELYLKGKEAEQAYMEQKDAIETDEREGLVRDYLEQLLPANWANLDLYQRRNFINGDDFGGGAPAGIIARERVCVMEIFCECFGKERANLKRSDSYEIEAIINKIEGWKKYDVNKSGKVRFPIYGPQKTFVRE